MSVPGPTPARKKTRFGKVADFERASKELDDEEIGELVEDLAEHTDDFYSEAQEVARSFHEDDHAKYNKNQMAIRETAKELVDKHSQPDWAWSMLSVYSEDMGTRLLDIPSEGSSKGLLVDEDFETAFLYPKEEDEHTAVEHVRKWSDNGVNAQSLGYECPAEDMERISLDVSGDMTGLPVLAMDYNGEMVLDSREDEFLSSINRELEPQDRNQWAKDSQPEREEYLEQKGVDNLDNWTVGLEFLIEHDYLENWGVIEYRRGRDNTAIDPETGTRIMVDLGEYRVGEENSSSGSTDDSYDFEFSSGNINRY